jgi:hypothetical protein
MSRTTSTHRGLWPGIDLKLRTAGFHFLRMQEVLKPPETTAYTVVQEASGALIGGNWHQGFYAHLDGFLSSSRSVPELIRCCFGTDLPAGNRVMRKWFEEQDEDEKNRRREFDDKFRPEYQRFRSLPLSMARNIIEHRTGVAPVVVTVNSLLGITYIGGPTAPIPTSEIRDLPADSNLPPGIGTRALPVQPMWSDFEIDGKPLFETCREYLDRAQALVAKAREAAESIHGGSKLTSPPNEM